jgi:ABC-type molybdenum transport system ATPase subunit/photorepair protein PhrA
LQGHNGSGKSTLLSLLNGDHPQAYANEIYLSDKSEVAKVFGTSKKKSE